MTKTDSNLDKSKKEYKKFQDKYGLADFDFLNENFEIESIECENTELFLKRIRKQMTEKISSGLRALELFLNPQSAPMFIFSIIKSFSQTDKDILTRLYHKFAEFEILAFGLENEYDEKKEAEFIKNVTKDWKEICKDFNRISESMRVNYKKDSKKNEKSYFG